MKKFFTYILLLSNGNYYTGITNNLYKRLHQHQKGQCISTRKHRPVILKHMKNFETRVQARKKEVEIKNKGAKQYLRNQLFNRNVV